MAILTMQSSAVLPIPSGLIRSEMTVAKLEAYDNYVTMNYTMWKQISLKYAGQRHVQAQIFSSRRMRILVAQQDLLLAPLERRLTSVKLV
jgi:hypothetical protein